MKDRIKLIRKETGLNQTEFGDKIGVTQSAVTGWESGTRIPTGAAFSAICKTFDVNEEWLRSGTGEMRKPLTENQQIARFLTDVMGTDDEIKRRLVLSLSKLDVDEWKLIEKIALEMTKED